MISSSASSAAVRLGFAPPRGGFESRANIGHLLDALADGGEVGVRFGAAGRVVIDAARLIPVDADRADDVVDQPALFDPAARLYVHASKPP